MAVDRCRRLRPGAGAGLQGLRDRIAAVGGTFSATPGELGFRPRPVPARGGSGMTIRVALVDDQELVRTGLAMVIDACEDMRVVAQAGDGAQALASWRRRTLTWC